MIPALAGERPITLATCPIPTASRSVTPPRPEPPPQHFSQHWFLTEQREEVSSMSALLAVVERAAETNLLLAEDYLARNPVGDQGAPEAGAPPAAGGAL
jgi:hypothetical protein